MSTQELSRFNISIPVSQEIIDDLEAMRPMLEAGVKKLIDDYFDSERDRLEREFLYGTGEKKPVGLINA